MIERKATGSVNYSASTSHYNPRLHEPNYTQVGQKERRKKAEKLNIFPQESSHTNVAYQTTRNNTTAFISKYHIKRRSSSAFGLQRTATTFHSNTNRKKRTINMSPPIPQHLNFITGNANKLAEVQAILTNVIELRSQNVDLVEIQGTVEEVTRDKCKRAAEAVSSLFFFLVSLSLMRRHVSVVRNREGD
jgi:hypothetical protein